MRKGLSYRLALLLLSAAFMTGCAGSREAANEAVAEEVETTMALPQAGEAVDSERATGEEVVITTTETETEKPIDSTQKNNKKATKGTITVATVGSPNTEILAQASILLEEKGYALKVEVCEDYLVPNQMVLEGQADCNFYQHQAFLERYNIEHASSLVEVEKIHYEPLAIYSKTVEDVNQVQKGMKVAILDNPTAIARALWLLQDVELLTLMSDADINTVKDDIEKNPYDLEFVFVEESTLVTKLDEVDLVICGKNLLMQEAMDEEELLLAAESQDTMMVQQLAQIVVAADTENEKAQMLTEVLLSEEMKQFVDTKYQGSVLIMEEAKEDLQETQDSKETESKEE